jgi:hypothetical protein
MSGRRQPYTPQSSLPTAQKAPAVIGSAPMPETEKIEAAMANMSLHPEDAPALREAYDMAVHTAREQGRPTSFGMESFDLSALPGTTLADSAPSGVSISDDQEAIDEEARLILAQSTAEAERKRRAHEQALLLAAAQSGVPVAQLFDNEATRKRILSEKRYMVMPSPEYMGEKAFTMSISCVEFTIYVGRPQMVPYSIMADLVCMGRIAPPHECPELIASSLHAAACKGTISPLAKAANGQAYLGASAQGASYRDLYQDFEQQTRGGVVLDPYAAQLPRSSSQPISFL